jgi:hypothetical protein
MVPGGTKPFEITDECKRIAAPKWTVLATLWIFILAHLHLNCMGYVQFILSLPATCAPHTMIHLGK